MNWLPTGKSAFSSPKVFTPGSRNPTSRPNTSCMSCAIGASLCATSAICLSLSHMGEPSCQRSLSATPELGFALLRLGGECLASVFGLEHPDVALAFERDVSGKVPSFPIHEVSLQRAQRYRRGIGEPCYDHFDFIAKSSIGKNARDEPDPQRLGGVELARQEIELASARRTDDSREAPWTAHIARDANVEKSDVEAR